MKKFAKMALAAAIAGLSFAASAGIVIDDFSVGQGVGPGPTFVKDLRDITADGSGFYSSVTGATTSILGGERDMFIESIKTDGAGAAVNTYVAGGTLKYSTDSGAAGRSIIKWDGIGSGSASAVVGTETQFAGDLTKWDSGTSSYGVNTGGLNVAGLNNLNLALTGNAFLIDVLEADIGFDFAITVYTDATHWTTLAVSSIAHDPDFPIPSEPIHFADFYGGVNEVYFEIASGARRWTGSGGSADMTNVGALVATVNFSGALKKIDLTIDNISTVPEPESLALVGLGLLGLAAARRRKTA